MQAPKPVQLPHLLWREAHPCTYKSGHAYLEAAASAYRNSPGTWDPVLA